MGRGTEVICTRQETPSRGGSGGERPGPGRRLSGRIPDKYGNGRRIENASEGVTIQLTKKAEAAGALNIYLFIIMDVWLGKLTALDMTPLG